MLKYFNGLTKPPSPPLNLLPVSSSDNNPSVRAAAGIWFSIGALKLGGNGAPRTLCGARRRVRYDEEDGEDEDEEYGQNAQIAMLELYSQSARDEVLLVRALVGEKEAEVLIFKGFSSCLSYGTSPDPSRSVVPARAVIKSIDRIRGPFDPSNIEYLEQGLSWETFKTRLHPN